MKYKRLFSLLIAAMLAFPALAGVAAETRKDDLIRVLLTRFGTISELNVHIAGSYTCEGIAFQKGVNIRIAAGEKNRQLLLKYEGMTLAHTGPLTLVRHASEGENGLLLQGSLNLYTGDLKITQSGGQLRLVLSVPLEEYLLGVLPWEMSTGFPLEALKAQAVAARTYALTKRDSGRDYDVTDNTNDQVYAGISDNINVIREAVSATEGMCVYYQGKLVPCYYTASNGGMTDTIENVWGNSEGPTGYTIAKEDPYDYANDESVVKQATVPKMLKEDSWPELQDLLCAAAGKTLRTLGYSDAAEDIRVRSIQKISLADVKNGAAKTMVFQLLVDAVRVQDPSESEISFLDPEAKATPQPAVTTESGKKMVSLSNPVTVRLAIFPEVEHALQLSINIKENELWSVRENGDEYVIESRRFGHGVGMSQRGAQRMAAGGWTYKQILHFYYNSVTLRKAGLKASTPAPALSLVFDATPGPKPSSTPKPTLMPVTLKEGGTEVLAVVDGVASDSSLNLRASPDTSSEIITRLYYGQQLAVIERTKDWLHVRTDATEGYVMEKFVTVQE